MSNDMPNEDELEDALLWAAQGFPPRNEQTVAEAIRSYRHKEIQPILRDIGIDPDMSVSELQRRLRIAERVLSGELKLYRDITQAEYDAEVPWLTREDDQ